MCTIDLELCTVFRETYRTARKQHRCAECSSNVDPGQRYLSHFSVFEGDPNHGAICGKCARDRKRFFDEHGGGDVQAGGWRGVLAECVWEFDDDIRWRMMLMRLDLRRRNARRSVAA